MRHAAASTPTPAGRTARLASVLAGIAFLLTLPAASGAQPGTPAPEFNLPGKAGNVRLSDYKGKVVYLDFWASWCGPCKQSFPWMNDMQAKYAGQGLKVVAVNLDANTADGQRFLESVPANFDIAFDPKGTLGKLYAVKGMPSSLLIDRDGKVIVQHAGFNPEVRAQLEKAIQQSMEGK